MSQSNNTFTDNLDWYSEAHKLRQHNRELIKKVVQLEQNLKDEREILEAQVLRTRTGEVTISQQTAELEASQEQIQYLSKDLDKSDQTIQRQNILIETLSKQLETTQEQIARLERECALIKEEYDRQNQNLSEAQQQVEELTVRLHRQQRYTLEFKAALDECLEVPAPNNLIQKQLNGSKSSALIPRVNAIEPWSASESKFDLEESLPTLPPESESIQVKKITLPNLNTSSKIEKNYSVSPESSLAENLDVSRKSKLRKKDKSQAKINLPKLPRYHSS